MDESSSTVDEVRVLLPRLRAGDAGAMDDLIRAAGARLLALTRRMLRDFPGVRRWEESDDVLQNALIRLDRAVRDPAVAGRLGEPADFFRLATAQVRRELIDLARHYRGPLGDGANLRTPPGGAGAGAADWPPAGADPTDAPSRLANWTEFHERVGELPADEREAVDLLWYQELPQAEAAELLGVSVSTLRNRWRAARLRLFDLLGGELPF